MRIVVPEDTLLIEIQEQAEKHGLILITDGRDMKYTWPNMIPQGWTRFAIRVKPRRLDPREPRA